MMKEEIGNASLYQKLQSTLYKYGAYKKENLGEGMILVEELKGGYWKPRYLIDNEAETACEFMDSDYCLLTFSRNLWIERDDFMEDAPKKFFRMTPGKEVRLKNADERLHNVTVYEYRSHAPMMTLEERNKFSAIEYLY